MSQPWTRLGWDTSITSPRTSSQFRCAFLRRVAPSRELFGRHEARRTGKRGRHGFTSTASLRLGGRRAEQRQHDPVHVRLGADLGDVAEQLPRLAQLGRLARGPASSARRPFPSPACPRSRTSGSGCRGRGRRPLRRSRTASRTACREFRYATHPSRWASPIFVGPLVTSCRRRAYFAPNVQRVSAKSKYGQRISSWFGAKSAGDLAFFGWPGCGFFGGSGMISTPPGAITVGPHGASSVGSLADVRDR